MCLTYYSNLSDILLQSLSDILQQAELGNYLSDILLQSLSDILQQAKLDNYQLSDILQHSKLRGC